MVGIASLMPKPGAATPAAEISQYAGMGLEELVALFQQRPSGVLLRKIEDETKAQQRRAAAQNQGAMAQMQQQPGTVKDMVLGQAVQSLQPTQMAAHGGIMHGYAGGGAVAFQSGTSARGLPFPASPARIDLSGDVPIYAPGPDKKPGETEAEYQARKQKEAAEADEVANRPLRRLYNYLAEKIREPSAVAQMRAPAAQQAAQETPAAPSAARPDIPRFTSQELERYVKTAAPAPAPAPSAPTGGQRQAAAAPPAPATPAQGLQNLVDLDKAQKEELDRIQGRQAVDPTVAAARAAERKGAEEVVAGRQTRAETQRTEAQRQLDEALKRGRTSLFDDPEALLRVAAGIDVRRGKGVGSLAGGLADIMGQRRSEATAARKEFQTAQNLYNQEMNALDTLRQLQRERDTAIATGDVAAARAIQDQITNVNRFYQKAKEDRQNAERNYQLDVLKTQATQDQARAAAAQAARDPEEIRTMRALGIPLTEAGFKTFAEIKSTGRLEGAAGRNNVAALRELGEWEKGLGANIKEMNAKNPQVYEDARRAKIREINATLGSTIPLDGGAGAGAVDTNNPLLKK